MSLSLSCSLETFIQCWWLWPVIIFNSISYLFTQPNEKLISPGLHFFVQASIVYTSQWVQIMKPWEPDCKLLSKAYRKSRSGGEAAANEYAMLLAKASRKIRQESCFHVPTNSFLFFFSLSLMGFKKWDCYRKWQGVLCQRKLINLIHKNKIIYT